MIFYKLNIYQFQNFNIMILAHLMTTQLINCIWGFGVLGRNIKTNLNQGNVTITFDIVLKPQNPLIKQ